MGKIFCFMGKMSSGIESVFNVVSEDLNDKINTFDSSDIDLTKNNYMVISDLNKFIHLKEIYSIDSVIPIYIEMDDGLRLENAINYEIKQPNPNYHLLCQQYIDDEKKYSKDNLTNNGINKTYLNNNTLECVSKIEKDILEYIKKEKQYRI